MNILSDIYLNSHIYLFLFNDMPSMSKLHDITMNNNFSKKAITQSNFLTTITKQNRKQKGI